MSAVVVRFRRRPVRAVVIREQLGNLPNGDVYRFLIAVCVIGRRPAAKPYGARDLDVAMGIAKTMAHRSGLPIVREFGNARDPQPPVAA